MLRTARPLDGLMSLGAVAILGLTLSSLLWSLTPHPRSYRVAASAQPTSELAAEAAHDADLFAYAFEPESRETATR